MPLPPNQPTLNTPANSLPLGTLSATGEAPKSRLSNAAQAATIYWTLHDSNQPRLARAQPIQGMFDGNPPYNPVKMRNAGRGAEPNFNTLEAASRKEAAKTPFYDLLTAAPLYADCDTDLDGPYVDATTASRVRAEAFDRMLRSYDGFDNQFWTMFDDFIAFNKGFLWWPQPDSWHFKRIRWDRVLFPDGTSNDPDEWEMFAITHKWPPHMLWKFIREEKAARAVGWNREQVVDAIRRAAPDDIRGLWTDPMEVQRAYRDCDLYYSAKSGVIQAASIYVREFDGTWSRMMIEVQDRRTSDGARDGSAPAESKVERVARTSGQQPLAPDGRTPEQERTDKSWLYFKTGVADSLYQIMCPFIFDPGDGSMVEISGLGKRIVSYSQAMDRMENAVAHNAMLRSSIVLQAQTGSGQNKAAIVQLGGATSVLPPGYAVQPGTIFGDIEGPLAVTANMRNRLDANTGIYRPTFEKPQGNPESARGAEIRFSMFTQLTASSVNRFYKQENKFLSECFRRATMDLPRTSKNAGVKAALAYQQECAAAGLTREQCRDQQPDSIRAQTANGNGSMMLRQQNMAAIGLRVPFMGPRGLRAYNEDYAAAYGGRRAATRYFPLADTAQVPTRDDWDANQENAEMQQGQTPVFADWQNHTIHANVHLTAALGAITAVTQQGADPAIPFTFLQVALPHVVQHIAKVPIEQTRKELEAAYKQVAQGAKEVEAAAQQQMQQRSQLADLTLEQQLKVMQVQNDVQIKNAKAGAQMQQRQEKHQFDMALAAQEQRDRTSISQGDANARFEQEAAKATQAAALEDARTAHDITTSTVKTAAEIRNAAAKTQADIENARRKAEAQAEAARSKPKGGAE